MKYKKSIIVAVTGGMGSGQSTTCSFFKEWGCKIINADAEAKNIIQNDKGLQKDLKRLFSADTFDKSGNLNTTHLAEQAFKDDEQTKKLNQLIHPKALKSLEEKIKKAALTGFYPIIIVDAALIYENNLQEKFDYIIVVNANIKNREKRVFERSRITREQFQNRINKQIDLNKKIEWSDYVIENNGSLDDLKNATQKVYWELLKNMNCK